MNTTIKMQYEQRRKAFIVLTRKVQSLIYLQTLNLHQTRTFWLVVLRFNATLTAMTKFWTGQTAFTEYMGECNTILSAYTLYKALE